MFERTIVAFDGSNRSEDALALALRLRDPAVGALVLACVGAPVGQGHVPRRGEAIAGVEAEEVAAMLADARHRVAPGVRVEARARVAVSAARGLTELAEDEGADLLVVGSSRRAPSGRIALERTAGRLLQGAPCAVALAPADARESGAFRDIAVAYDGSPEAWAAVEAGYVLAARDRAALTLLRALPAQSPGVAAELDAVARAAPDGVEPRTVLLYGDPGSAIAEACDGSVDLLVCGSRGYGPLQRALAGSVSTALIENASHPVLVLPRTTGSTPRATDA